MSLESSTTRQTRAEQARRLAWLEAQAPLGWAIILVLVAMLGAIYLGQASRTATMGRHVQDLQSELEDLRRQNSALERDIAEAQSLDRLESDALALGFIPAEPENIDYLIVPNYPALAPIPDRLESKMPRAIESFEEAGYIVMRSGLSKLFRGDASER